MMSRTFSLLALCLALVAGCSQRASGPLPVAAPQNGIARIYPDFTGFAQIYAFKPVPDGAEPAGAMVLSSGTLYGTTCNGGAKNFGSIYKVSASGKESVLHSFAGAPDGKCPQGALVYSNGV